ncbi:MAG: TrkH family potassium uptake protein [Paracoccaceae bacterium]|nr:TrkH family potassium uptake protein [Paracoccaceae bacterium]
MARFSGLPLLVVLLGLSGLAMYVPALHAMISREYFVARAFFYSGTATMVLVGFLALTLSNYRPAHGARSHLLQQVGAFSLLPLFLALPVTEAMPGFGFVDAWFEMVSSFTTTGASVFSEGAAGPFGGPVPMSVHLWRALVGWGGGFFVLLSAMAILAPLNLGGFEVISGEPWERRGGAFGRQIDPSERIMRFASVLFAPYFALTVALWGALLVAGDSAIVALCHAMATLSTSGISPIGGLERAASGRVGEALVVVFLLLAFSRMIMPGMHGARSPISSLRQDPELRLGLGLVGAVGLGLWLLEVAHAWAIDAPGGPLAALAALWAGLFTATSFLTTTGFVSADWGQGMLWSGFHAPGVILIGLCLVGGGLATTAGGVKLMRVYALYRHGTREVERLIHPSSVAGAGRMGRFLRRKGAQLAWVFVMLFLLSIAVLMAGLTLAGLEFEPAMVLSVAALTTTGPLAEWGGATPIFYGAQSESVKFLLGVAMVLGRVELFALITLLAPDGWRN